MELRHFIQTFLLYFSINIYFVSIYIVCSYKKVLPISENLQLLFYLFSFFSLNFVAKWFKWSSKWQLQISFLNFWFSKFVRVCQVWTLIGHLLQSVITLLIWARDGMGFPRKPHDIPRRGKFFFISWSNEVSWLIVLILYRGQS